MLTDERPTALEALHHPWLEAAAADANSTRRSGWLSSRSSSSSSSSDEEEGQADRHTSNTDTSSSSYDDSLVQRLQQYGTYNRCKRSASFSSKQALDRGMLCFAVKLRFTNVIARLGLLANQLLEFSMPYYKSTSPCMP
eukprot:scaffold8874_cov21-Tisochrysis_lutea.AAC.5